MNEFKEPMNYVSILYKEISESDWGYPSVGIKHSLGLLPGGDVSTDFWNGVASVRYLIKDKKGCYLEFRGKKYYFNEVDPGVLVLKTIKACPNVESFKGHETIGALYIFIRHIMITNKIPDINLEKIKRLLSYHFEKNKKTSKANH